MIEELARKSGLNTSEKLRGLVEPLIERTYTEELKEEQQRGELAKVAPELYRSD